MLLVVADFLIYIAYTLLSSAMEAFVSKTWQICSRRNLGAVSKGRTCR